MAPDLWSLLWTCVILCFKLCKEAVEVVEQRDIAVADLWLGFIICESLNTLPQALCVCNLYTGRVSCVRIPVLFSWYRGTGWHWSGHFPDVWFHWWDLVVTWVTSSRISIFYHPAQRLQVYTCCAIYKQKKNMTPQLTTAGFVFARILNRI